MLFMGVMAAVKPGGDDDDTTGLVDEGSPAMITPAERETILRFDEEERVLHLWTASPTQARRWLRRGIVLVEHRDGKGHPFWWNGTAPLGCLRPLRKLDGRGQLPKQARQVPVRTIGRKDSGAI